MKLNPAIPKVMKYIALGVLIGDALMIAVFALLKKLDYTVFLGTLLGSVGAVLNFFVMCVRAQKAMENPERARLIIQRSYTMRMLAVVAVMVLGVAVSCFHAVAVILPFLFPSITIKVMQMRGFFESDQKGGEET